MEQIQASDITQLAKLDSNARYGKKRLLHVGCGSAGREATHHRFHGLEWEHVRFDIDERCKPDVVGDIRTLDGVADDSVDGIFSSHNLEHLHWNDVFQALKNFHRVLKDRGHLIIAVPDFEMACRWIGRGAGLEIVYEGPAGPITPIDMVFGFRPYTYDNAFMQHRVGFTRKWMKNVLVDQGFADVQVVSTQPADLWGFARKVA